MSVAALDTNVLAYAIGVNRHADDAPKIDHARAVLKALTSRFKLVVAVQALLELHNLLTRGGLSRAEAGDEIERVRTYALALPTLVSTMENAVRLAERHRFTIFDAAILSASADAGADWLLTEDMQDGFLHRSTRLINPFASLLPELLGRLNVAE